MSWEVLGSNGRIGTGNGTVGTRQGAVMGWHNGSRHGGRHGR